MKNVWKRVLSLVLSGVLLLGNMPFEALATEETAVTETQAVETQPVETQPPETQPVETQPAETQPVQIVQTTVTTAEVTNDVANEGLVPLGDSVMTITGNNAGATYDEEKNTLTLSGASVESVDCKHDSSVLTIVLTDDSTNTISGALSALKGIKITGKGTLSVNQIDAGENLTIEGAVVKVGVERKENETQKTVITVKDTVTLSDEAHLATAAGQKGIAFTDNEDGAQHKIKGEGYYRTAQAGENSVFSKSTGEAVGTTDGYFEFVAEKHLSSDFNGTDTGTHFRTCEDDSCLLRSGVKVDETPHGTETKYIIDSEQGTHQKAYACCGRTIDDVASSHDNKYVCSGAELTYQCSACGTIAGTLTVNKPADLVWNGENKSVTFTATEALETLKNSGEVKYYPINEDETLGDETTDTSEPGSYRTVVTFDGVDGQLQVDFTVEKKPLSDDMISTIGDDGKIECVPKTQERGEPSFTVQDDEILVNDKAKQLVKGTDYTVKYYRDTEETQDFTTAGVIRVEITAMAGSQYYTGMAKQEYEIVKLDVPVDAYTPELPKNGEKYVYDGTAKPLSCTLKSAYTNYGIGNATVKFYQKIDEEETEVPAIDAGEYTVKIHVKASDNYKEATLENPAWTFTIEPANVGTEDAPGKVYTDNTKREQVLVRGADDFEKPSFTGFTRQDTNEADQLSDTVTFTYGADNLTTTDVGDVKSYLNGLPDGSDVDIKYTLTPDNTNYTGTTKEQTIQVTKVIISFTHNGNPVSATSATSLLTNGNIITYGAEGFISLKGLAAQSNGVTDNDEKHFFVKYVKEGTNEEKDYPDAGSNKFYVYYSGELNGVTFTKMPVYDPDYPAYLTVNKKTPSQGDVTKPTARELMESAGEVKELQNLITPGKDGDLDLEYSLTGNENDYSTTIPRAAVAGVYTVYYRSPANANYTTPVEGSVQVVITPYLTATYGEKLADVENRISTANGTWKFNNTRNGLAEVTQVGNVNAAGNTFKIDFYPNGKTEPTATDKPVKIYVEAAHVELDISMEKTHHKYTGTEVKPTVTVKVKQNAVTRETVTDSTFPAKEYELVYSNITNTDEKVVNPGKAQVTVRSKGNYIIDNANKMTLEYVVYRAGSLELKDAESAVPPELRSDYETGTDIKEALGKKYGEEYPESKRTYIKYLMMNENKAALYDEFYWPDDGYGTLTWEYENSLTKDDTFKIYGMYMVTSERLNTKAGDIFELTETTSSTPDTNQYYKGTDGIKFRLKNYAVLCFAGEVDPDTEYTITKTVSPSSSYGTLSVKADSTAASKAKAGTKLSVTAKANTGYSLKSVTVTDASSKTVEITKVSEGNYEFTMPASNVKVTATFAKNTVNPSSGDTSHIYLWATVMAVSGLCAVALIVYWLKKRKK